MTCLDVLQMIQYANDSILFSSKSVIDELSVVLNTSLNNFYIWLNANYLTINFDKPTFTIITLRKKPSNKNIIIKNVSFSYSDSFKFIGLILDSRLSFNVHINYVVSKVSKNRGSFINLSYLPRSILHSLFFSSVYPYLYYCIEAKGWYLCFYNTGFFFLQKKIIRIIYGIPYFESTAPAFYNLSILKLSDMCRYFSLLYFTNFSSSYFAAADCSFS